MWWSLFASLSVWLGFSFRRASQTVPHPSALFFSPSGTPQNFDHYLVYWIAPTVGAVLATVLFAVFQASFLDDGEKSKED